MSQNQRLHTIQESLRAPGLPNFPGSLPEFGSLEKTRFVSVSSVNYDYLFTNLDSPKMLWIDLTSPAPIDLKVGSPVKLHLGPETVIQTTLSKHNLINSIFEVDDIIGSRVVLNPYKGSAWLPTTHASCDSPFGWGYDMRRVNVSTSMHNDKYGYGVPISSLEYYPDHLTEKEKLLQAMHIEEDYYWGSKYIPGWND